MTPSTPSAPTLPTAWVPTVSLLVSTHVCVASTISLSVRFATARFGQGRTAIEPAANLLPNPRLTGGTTGFLKSWGSETSLAAIDGDGPLGHQHFLRVVTTTSHIGEGLFYGAGGQLAVSAGVPNTASVYVRGAGTVRLRLAFTTGGGAAIGPDHALTGQWERLTVTAIPDANTSGRAIVETTTAHVATIEAGAWQFEASPHPTAYLDGSMGAGFSWVGTADQSASLRQAGRLTLPAQVTSLVRGGVALWWRAHHAAAFTRDRVLLHIPTAGAPLQLRHIVATNRIRLTSPAGDTVEVDAPAFDAGDDLLLTAGWTRDHLEVGVAAAGSDVTTVRGGRSVGRWVASGRMDLGSTGSATPSLALHADGVLGPAWFFDGPPGVEVLRVLARSATLPRLVVGDGW